MVAAIVYYSDTGVTGGATAVVPRQGDNDPVYQWPYVHMPGIAGRPFVNNRESAERMLPAEDAALRAQCYAREVMPHFRPGDVLLYRMDVWHRGICHWNAGWTQKMYGGWLETFVCSLNETQRSTLGFPRLAALAPEVRPRCARRRAHGTCRGCNYTSISNSKSGDGRLCTQTYFRQKTKHKVIHATIIDTFSHTTVDTS